MTKKLLSLALAAILLAALIPAALADSETTMYVYTENGKTLNVRSAPAVGDNIVAQARYGDPVSVVATSDNGWSTIWWQDENGEFHNYYVQSRFLVNDKPGAKPSTKPTAAPSASTEASTEASSKASNEASKVLSDMNKEFASAQKVSPYTVVARPSRASGWVNLRWAPTTEAERIATCPQGKELTVLVEMKNWYQVQDPATDMIGFISSQYVIQK